MIIHQGRKESNDRWDVSDVVDGDRNTVSLYRVRDASGRRARCRPRQSSLHHLFRRSWG